VALPMRRFSEVQTAEGGRRGWASALGHIPPPLASSWLGRRGSVVAGNMEPPGAPGPLSGEGLSPLREGVGEQPGVVALARPQEGSSGAGETEVQVQGEGPHQQQQQK